MRVWIGCAALLAIVVIASAATSGAVKGKNGRPALPASGIKTPGVRIAFSQLRPEAQVPLSAKPQWIFFANSVFVPSAAGLDRIDPKTNKTAQPITGLNKPCGGMASGFGSLWTPVCGDGALGRLDAKEYKISAKLPIGASAVPGAVAATADSMWALVDEKTTLSRIDPDANSVVAEVRLPAGCRSLVYGEKALWVACPGENKVLRINPETNLVEKRIEVSAQPEALVAGEGSIWALCRKDGKLDRIDPKTNKVAKTIELGVPGAGGAMTFGDGSLWVTMPGFPITRIDPKTETVAQQFYGEGGGAIEWSKGALWLSNEGALWRIDPKLVVMTLAE